MKFLNTTIKLHGKTLIWALVLGTLLSACAQYPSPPRPNGPKSSAIGLEMVSNLVGIDSVLMIKLDESGRVADRKIIHVLLRRHAEYREIDVAGPKRIFRWIVPYYVFSVENGTYAIIGHEEGGKFGFFSEEDIKKSITKVEPGSFKFMGQYHIRTPTWPDWKKPDRAQKHYWRLIVKSQNRDPVTTILGAFSIFGPAYYPPRKSKIEAISVNAKTEAEFLEISKEALQGGGWDSRIDKRLGKIRQ